MLSRSNRFWRPEATRRIAARPRAWPSGLLLVAIGACGPSPDSASPPADSLARRVADGLVDREALLRLSEAAQAGDVQALFDGLSDSNPAVRARAAYSLPTALSVAGGGTPTAEPYAGVGPPGSLPLDLLAEVLDDTVSEVRANAAFAIGASPWAVGTQGSPIDRAAALLAARLAVEEEPGVRERAIRALGRLNAHDSPMALRYLADGLGLSEPSDNGPGAPSPTSAESYQALLGERHLWTAALALVGGSRQDVPLEVRDYLTEMLLSPGESVRRSAASFFSIPVSVRSWGGRGLFLRQALDEYDHSEPAARHAVAGLAFYNDFMNASRLREWSDSATDWRTRAAALGGLDPMTISVYRILDALDDPYAAVAHAAAAQLATVPLEGEIAERVDAWLAGRSDHLGAVRELLVNRASSRAGDLVIGWAREASSPSQQAVAIEGLAYLPDERAADALEKMRSDFLGAGPGCDRKSIAAGSDVGAGSSSGAAMLAQAPRLDRDRLRDLGPAPVLEVATSRGAVMVELFTEEAPFAVRTLATLADSGELDCRWVEPDGPAIIIRERDWLGDSEIESKGEPALAGLATEITWARPGRGAVVLAGWGRETTDGGRSDERRPPRLVILRAALVHYLEPIAVVGRVTDGLAVLDRLDYLDTVHSVRVQR